MTQKRGLGRGLGALIPGAGTSPAPEQELRTRVRPASQDGERTPRDRPVDMFFSGDRVSEAEEREERARSGRHDIADDMARAAATRRGRGSTSRTTTTRGTAATKAAAAATATVDEAPAEVADAPAKKTPAKKPAAAKKTTPAKKAPAKASTKASPAQSSTAKTPAKKTAATEPAASAKADAVEVPDTSTTSPAPTPTPTPTTETAAPAPGSGPTPTAAETAPAAEDTPVVEAEPAEPAPAQPVEDVEAAAPTASPGTATQPEAASESAPEAEPAPEPEPEPAADPEAETAPENEPKAETATEPDAAPEAAEADATVESSSADDGSRRGLVSVPGAEFAEIPIHEIRENPRNPRTMFDDDELDELAFSLREVGVLQPVVVRPIPVTDEGESFELVMGERRWRAARRAELTSIPAIIRETSDDDLLRDALLENLHRAQLNPLEEANAYQQLLEDFGCTQDELGDRIGRSRPQITNTLRLLRLPALVQRRLASGALSAGHARALLSLDDQTLMEELAQRIVSEGLSVRAVERLVSRGGQQETGTRVARRTSYDPHVVDMTSRLSNRLETPVKIDVGKRKGKITMEFSNLEDLDRLLESMGLDVAKSEGDQRTT
ncbi:ParB/RepB/Spo0J family partition protein [Brachybacterium alimentarium]|uniref:ParB/RepB/Spo0J family partition protein n=1 Tax=Brachybacterium alimentarium TaxID=47845 RepID=UPI003FD03815